MDNEQVYQNTQHAIVEAIHILGQNSGYNDGSVRMKEIFAFIKDAVIMVDGQPQPGPHRFSMFNSALVGRRSAQEIFERIEEPHRQGAWWKLKIPYEDAIQIACQQKGDKSHQERIRKPEAQEELLNPQNAFNCNGSTLKDNLNIIQTFLKKVINLREENKNLENHLIQLNGEISLLKQSSSPEVISMLEAYIKAIQRSQMLKNDLIRAQSQLNQASQSSFSHQDMILE